VGLLDLLIDRGLVERRESPTDARVKLVRLVVEPIGVRMPNEFTAVVATVGGIGKGDRIGVDKSQTFTLCRREERWECVAFQNTKMSRRSRRAAPEAQRGRASPGRRSVGRGPRSIWGYSWPPSPD
jgi:hypothetical protein